MKRIVFLLLLILLTACGNDPTTTGPEPAVEEIVETNPTDLPTSTVVPTESTIGEPAATIPPTLTAVPTTMPTVESVANENPTAAAPSVEPSPPPSDITMDGQNPDGSFFRGLAAAPITMIDYSDFL